MAAILAGDGYVLVDDQKISVRYYITSLDGVDAFSISFSTIADYARCRDGKTVRLQTGNGTQVSGFITGPFDHAPTKFCRLADGDEGA